MDRGGLGLIGLTVLATLYATTPRLHLALEGAGDPAPRRFAMTAEVAGRCTGLVISWSARLR